MRDREVTDMQRSQNGGVISSTFDEPASRHVQVTDKVIEKARLVEHKREVVILLDSITRLARAITPLCHYQAKVLTGGVKVNALATSKAFFMQLEMYSEVVLTIIATALLEQVRVWMKLS